jgi:uncharacterized membrane protein YoaK (UPF0700 family)
MLLGAIAGALLTQVAGASALWVVAAFAMLIALAARLIPKPLQRRFNQSAAARASAQRAK